MMSSDELSTIIERIGSGTQTATDVEALRVALTDRGQDLLQLGKYNVNIGEGKGIRIGAHVYNEWNQASIQALVKEIQKVSGVHQNTQGGDAAGGNIDKRNITIIQILTQDSHFSNSPQEPFNTFDLSAIPTEAIQQAYQDALPPDANLWGAEESEVSQILEELEEFRRLPEFFICLSQDQSLPEAIRNQLSQIAQELTAKKPPESKSKPPLGSFDNTQESRESYLIATIEPSEDDSKQFLLNAWLITDDSASVNDLSKFKSLLDQDEHQRGTVCRFDDIPKQLNKFLKKSLEYLRGQRYQLIIEVFLPSDLISTEVDRWQIPDPIAEEIALGIKYPIRLRSLERLNFDYLDRYLSDWYKSWESVETVLHNEPIQELFAHLEAMDDFNWKHLRNNLREKIGLKVTCAPPKAKTKDLFKAILIATTPIAIWTRCDMADLDQVAEIDRVLTFKPLRHLCESIKEMREQADAQTEDHLGFHLALLWENPYRLPPDIMLELTTPGH